MTDIKPDLVVTDLPDASPSDPLEALLWLGETVEEIAQGLRARGIKGKRMDAEACPLTAYLKIWWKDVGVGRSIFHANNFPDEEFTATQELPTVFGQFVDRIDGGGFPDLIES